MVIGYTSGVFDLFHIGHLNLLENAAKECDLLFVGVCSDELVLKLKHRKPMIPFKDRIRIINALSCVSKAIPKTFDDDLFYAKSVNAKIVFKGSDWENTQKWLANEKRFENEKILIRFLPYTKGISSTKLKGLIE